MKIIVKDDAITDSMRTQYIYKTSQKSPLIINIFQPKAKLKNYKSQHNLFLFWPQGLKTTAHNI